MRTWKDVATLVKPKNATGRFVARAAAGLPFLLERGVEVAFVPPQTDLPRRGIVVYSNELPDGTFVVAFDTVTDEKAAHGLAGVHCLMRREDVQDLMDPEDPLSWNGWHVFYEDGRCIGEVTGLLDNPGQMLLEVQRPGDVPLAYIPVVDEFIVNVDERQHVLTVQLPPGLLTLNDTADGEAQ